MIKTLLRGKPDTLSPDQEKQFEKDLQQVMDAAENNSDIDESVDAIKNVAEGVPDDPYAKKPPVTKLTHPPVGNGTAKKDVDPEPANRFMEDIQDGLGKLDRLIGEIEDEIAQKEADHSAEIARLTQRKQHYIACRAGSQAALDTTMGLLKPETSPVPKKLRGRPKKAV